MFKPQVTVKNTGSVALKNYHAKLWFRVPEGKELYIPVDDWYTPVSKPSLKNVIVYKQALPFDSLEKIQHVIRKIARVVVSDKATVAIPADDAIELCVEIFKF